MVATNYVAYTSAINPPGASPVVSAEQVWSALRLKVRAGQDFVGAAIVSTDVLEESEEHGIEVVVREVVFREGNRRVKEVCKAYAPTKVDFHQKNGSLISNIISEGPKGSSENDLWMTYSFEWRHPELEGDEAGLAAAKEKERAGAKMAVENSIQAIRRLVQEGKL